MCGGWPIRCNEGWASIFILLGCQEGAAQQVFFSFPFFYPHSHEENL